eukprot:CAMPEP_0197823456 /NCGR_PEP_ID=MMETSP1437-20131217/798_1 /TAXON_ID=49252 ORGANISM="Eucampia antarctica, Strain CCMP1452" /NCGR_SAMPLE_ID=MMETSP1437 /ASSEMBLY_ACC=CAM_ASM_001096 /LENGTH=262 /DNA_ID=CAMNT_0043422635 /DNA_START=72 /DNA_END=860 /DNA_ORIENTATION=+
MARFADSKLTLFAFVFVVWAASVFNDDVMMMTVQAFAPSMNSMVGGVPMTMNERTSSMSRLMDSKGEVEDIVDMDVDMEEEDDEDYMLPPQQVKVLRKEVQRLKAQRSLKRMSLTDEEGKGAFTEETLQLISKTLRTQTELLEIRGISRGQRKDTRAISEMLAIQVERTMMNEDDTTNANANDDSSSSSSSGSFKPVFVLDTSKGFTAIFYSPFLEGTEMYEKNRIVLRSGYVKNRWARKPKAVRDIRGQIIKDDDGNIIRE